MNRNEESLKTIFSNSRDEYQKMLNRNKRENDLTLAQGEFDDKMDSNGYFIRGFYKWTPDSHNWGCEIDTGVYLVISYSTDSSYVKISLVENRKKIASDTVTSLNYDKVAEAAIGLALDNGFDASEEFEELMIGNSRKSIKSDMAIRQLEDEFKNGLFTKKEVVAILTRENGWNSDDAQYMADIYEKMYY